MGQLGEEAQNSKPRAAQDPNNATTNATSPFRRHEDQADIRSSHASTNKDENQNFRVRRGRNDENIDVLEQDNEIDDEIDDDTVPGAVLVGGTRTVDATMSTVTTSAGVPDDQYHHYHHHDTTGYLVEAEKVSSQQDMEAQLQEMAGKIREELIAGAVMADVVSSPQDPVLGSASLSNNYNNHDNQEDGRRSRPISLGKKIGICIVLLVVILALVVGVVLGTNNKESDADLSAIDDSIPAGSTDVPTDAPTVLVAPPTPSPVSPPQVVCQVAISTFSQAGNEEGWTISGDGVGPNQNTNNGNIETFDLQQGKAIWFHAPAAFRGNWSLAYGTDVMYDFGATHNQSTPLSVDVILFGNDRLIGHVLWDPDSSKTAAMTTYRIPLRAGNTGLGRWRVLGRADMDATEEIIRLVLEDVRDFRIRAEISREAETAYLDNVEVTSVCRTQNDNGNAADDSNLQRLQDGSCGVVSRFEERSEEGWTLSGDGEDLEWHILWDGNGIIEGLDGQFGAAWYFDAPSKFRGDFGSSYGMRLRFDFATSDGGTRIQDDDVRISGGSSGSSKTMYYGWGTAKPSNFVWGTFEVVLDASAGWKLVVDEAPGEEAPLATEADMREILGNIRSIRIKGEYGPSKDTGRLDNVILERPCL